MDDMLHRWGGTLLTAGGALLVGTGLFLAPRWLALLLAGLICLGLGWLWLTHQDSTHVQTSPQVEAATEAAESALLSLPPPAAGVSNNPAPATGLEAALGADAVGMPPARESDFVPEAAPQVTPPIATAPPAATTTSTATAVTALPDWTAPPTAWPTASADGPVDSPPVASALPSAPPPAPPALVAQVTTYQDGMPTAHHQVPIRLFHR